MMDQGQYEESVFSQSRIPAQGGHKIQISLYLVKPTLNCSLTKTMSWSSQQLLVRFWRHVYCCQGRVGHLHGHSYTFALVTVFLNPIIMRRVFQKFEQLEDIVQEYTDDSFFLDA